MLQFSVTWNLVIIIMLYSDYYNICATHVFSLIMNILFCSSFKPSSGIYRYHKLVHVLHVYENWGLHVRGSFWRCFFLNCDGWLYKHIYIYYHKLLRLFRKLVFLAFQWDLISPNKCVTYFYKKLIPSLVYIHTIAAALAELFTEVLGHDTGTVLITS